MRNREDLVSIGYRGAFLVLLAIFSFFLEQGRLDAPIRNTTWQLLKPAQAMAVGAGSFYRAWQAGWVLWHEGGSRLAQLEHERGQLLAQSYRLPELEKENQLLREELGKKHSPEVRVLRLYGTGQEWFIDGGEQQGVQSGMKVTKEGSLVGVVQEVYPHFSRVKTLLDEDWVVPVEVQSASASARGLYTFIHGYGEVRSVSQRLPIEDGSIVRTLGDQELPPGLLLGTVSKVLPESDGATWKILVELLSHPQHISFVEVREF